MQRLNMCNDLAEAMKALDGKNAAVCILSSVHIFSIPHCVVRPLGWVSRFISIESLFMSYLLTCRRVLGGLQIDEYNIAGRHHRCVVAIPLACRNLPEALFDDCA